MGRKKNVYLDEIRKLLYVRVDVNRVTHATLYWCSGPHTALSLAAAAGLERETKLLLGARADPALCRPLHKAGMAGYWPIVEALIRAKADVNRRNQDDGSDKVGATPLIDAVSVTPPLTAANVEWMRRLICEYGADVNKPALDSAKRTPMYAALAHCNDLAVQELVDSGALLCAGSSER
jgi:hypothetical protein